MEHPTPWAGWNHHAANWPNSSDWRPLKMICSKDVHIHVIPQNPRWSGLSFKHGGSDQQLLLGFWPHQGWV